MKTVVSWWHIFVNTIFGLVYFTWELFFKQNFVKKKRYMLSLLGFLILFELLAAKLKHFYIIGTLEFSELGWKIYF